LPPTGVRPVSVPYARPLSTVHRALPPGFILPYRVASSELLRARFRPILSDRADCQGLFPLHDITRASPRSRRFPSHRFVPSAGVRSLTTVCSSLGLRGLFHPRAVYRDVGPFRGSSLRAARHPRQAALPPCRCRPSARPDLATRRPPSDASASRLCSTRRCVRTGSVLSLAGGRSPHRVRSPPGSPTYGWGRGFPAAHRS